MGWRGLVLRLILRGWVLGARGCGGGSFRHLLRAELAQARHVEGAQLAGEAHRAVSAALLLLHATDLVLAGVENLCDTVDLDCQSPSAREDRVARVVLAARRTRHAEVGRPPVGRGEPGLAEVEAGNTVVVASNCANSLHSASTRALSALSNMLPTIVIPPRIHCPEPPSSGMSNWAMVPPPVWRANSMASTASRESP